MRLSRLVARAVQKLAAGLHHAHKLRDLLLKAVAYHMSAHDHIQHKLVREITQFKKPCFVSAIDESALRVHPFRRGVDYKILHRADDAYFAGAHFILPGFAMRKT